jgi:hypothetical protein
MASYLISYDLRKPGRNYDSLYAALAQYNAMRSLQSVWLLDSTQTAGQVRDILQAHIDPNDGLLVIEIGRGWGSFNLLNNSANWLKARRP